MFWQQRVWEFVSTHSFATVGDDELTEGVDFLNVLVESSTAAGVAVDEVVVVEDVSHASHPQTSQLLGQFTHRRYLTDKKYKVEVVIEW